MRSNGVRFSTLVSSVALTLTLSVALLFGAARSAPAEDLKAATLAVEAAEKDPAAVDAARLAVKAAVTADAKSVGAWVLARWQGAVG